ncbi:MAG TPA: DMT family transporter [Candidatus Competibacteraceae bacterium]|nr:DMT family transporter [Candidatus Competibacteraceae bacterium]
MGGSERWSAQRRGLLYGLLGVAGFSVTLPATRLAVAELPPLFVGLGRALLAAALAALLLALLRPPRPTARQWRGLVIVAAGVILGFPLLSAWAMQWLPANHGAVWNGLLPLATALAAMLRAGERPAAAFWRYSVLGSAIVVGYALGSGDGRLHPADLLMLGAVAAAALGYAEGGRLARELGGWQVICWALLLAAPFLAVPVAWHWPAGTASWAAWAGFAYVGVVSMFLAFFAWYRGLALGGIARVGQVQLLQPFLTFLASALLLGEAVTPLTLAVALAVVGCVAATR